ncbi:MAG: diacylglycerol kinase family protein [Eubacteriales bacterium]
MSAKNKNMHAKLIFNPASGAKDKSPAQLLEVIKNLQELEITHEMYLTQPEEDVGAVVREALEKDIELFVVCGGDGTVSAVARELVGTDAILGIIPTGTCNNIALSLAIPSDIESAVSLLRFGQMLSADMGAISCEGRTTPFFEVCSVGLLTKLFESSDEIQHGNILKLGEFLSKLTFSQTSDIRLVLDGSQEIKLPGHAVLISNMPYVSRNYLVGERDCFGDGLLDIHLFADMTKMDVVGYIVKGMGVNAVDDPRIQHFKASMVEIEASPPMPVMADGIKLGEGNVRVSVVRSALKVITGLTEEYFATHREIHYNAPVLNNSNNP